MKLPYKITLVLVALIFIISLLLSIADGGADGKVWLMAAYAGMGSLIVSGISLLVGIVMLIAKEKEWGQGFLISAGLLLLLGFVVCTGTWSSFSLHGGH